MHDDLRGIANSSLSLSLFPFFLSFFFFQRRNYFYDFFERPVALEDRDFTSYFASLAKNQLFNFLHSWSAAVKERVTRQRQPGITAVHYQGKTWPAVMSPEEIEATISGARGNAATFKTECANQSTRMNLSRFPRVSRLHFVFFLFFLLLPLLLLLLFFFFFFVSTMDRIAIINSAEFLRIYETKLVSSWVVSTPDSIILRETMKNCR